MYLMPLCLLLGLLGFPWTTCSGGSPLWLYALYMPVLGLSKYAEPPDFGADFDEVRRKSMEFLTNLWKSSSFPSLFHSFPIVSLGFRPKSGGTS